jgi:hypothetical protein
MTSSPLPLLRQEKGRLQMRWVNNFPLLAERVARGRGEVNFFYLQADLA